MNVHIEREAEKRAQEKEREEKNKRREAAAMEPCRSFGRIKPRKLGCAAILGCVLVPIIFLALLKSTSHSLPIWSFQLSIRAYSLPAVEAISSKQQGTEMVEMPLDLNESHEEERSSKAGIEMVEMPLDLNESHEEEASSKAGIKMVEVPQYLNESHEEEASSKAGIRMKKLPQKSEEKQVEDKPIEIPPDNKETKLSLIPKESQEPNNSTSGNLMEKHKLVCDFTQPTSDTCSAHGDVRVVGNSSSIILALPPQLSRPTSNTSWKIRPYARKWEITVMEYIKEWTLKTSHHLHEAPACTLTHNVPAILFSTGGFTGNFFHDFTDLLVPLFVTSRQFDQEVQFLITNFNSRWIDKYRPIVNQLSRYEIINLDSDNRVHCFKDVQVGLLSHKVLGIDSSKSPNGYSMTDFRDFIRKSLSLKRKYTKSIDKQSRKKPRLLILLRKGSRSLMNSKEVITMARRLGYKVIAATAEKMMNLTQFAQIVNSCDVMMGVHGAGLANMIFLPVNATLIQIIPWGELKYPCRHDFGDPAPDMGLRYVEYEIKEEESSLIDEYPRDHAVFKDPLSIHRQGFNAMWSIFLNKQKVKLDVNRFRRFMLEVLQSLKQ